MFLFRSPTAKIRRAAFLFAGGGLGGGGSIGGAGLPDLSSGRIVYTKLKCDSPFSVSDLNWSGGRVSSAGVGFVAGYGAVCITAFGWGGFRFNSQTVHGLGIQTGLSAVTTVGIWKQFGSAY